MTMLIRELIRPSRGTLLIIPLVMLVETATSLGRPLLLQVMIRAQVQVVRQLTLQGGSSATLDILLGILTIVSMLGLMFWLPLQESGKEGDLPGSDRAGRDRRRGAAGARE